jgi:hypothetical protein
VTLKALFRSTALLISAVGCFRGQIGDSPAGQEPPPVVGGGAPGGGPMAGGSGGTSAPPVSDTPPCNPMQKSFAPARLWQLTDEEYVNVVRDVLGVTLTGDDARIASAGTAGRYTNYSEELSIDTQVAPNYQTAAAKVADLAGPRMGNLVGAAPTTAQMRTFISTKVARLWRRPLQSTEVDALLALYNAGVPDGAALGFHLVLEAVLQAPSFLYRTEVGKGAAGATGPVQLTTFELASALSFLFLESAPDDALWARAASGELDTPAGLGAEVDRLMALPAARTNMTSKASYWLGLAGLTNRSRDSRLYPEWNETLKTSLASSVQLFLTDIITNGKLADLFTSNRVYVNRQLGQLYGIQGAQGSTLVPVEVPGNQRSAGILSQPGLIVSANRTIDRADVVHRGLLVYDGFVCGGTVPPAPPEAGDEAKKMDGTERERAEGRDSKAGCLPCHSRFDPLGLTFERYDALGRYTETRQAVLDSMTSVTSWQMTDKPIDASAELADDGRGDGVSGHVDGLGDLAAKLAAAPVRVGNCASRRLAEYALGYNPAAENSCELKAVKDVLVTSGSFTQFFRALALSPGFRTRNPLPPPRM